MEVIAQVLPLTDPVFIIAIAMFLFFVSLWLFERVRLPGIIGIVLAGILFAAPY